jgi:aspartyl-tRNA(Asn)/glutamyl-tRNA(Gln) amidotransferase subunit A
VARLREAGAVFFGKTMTPEFGWKGVTDSPLTGIARNPWNETKTPGGSSGGAVVAVACGIGAIALGGDGCGSIRMPCGFAGVYGIKPTAGRAPNVPSPSVGTMTTPGPIARNVGDAALMLRVLAGADWRDAAAGHRFSRRPRGWDQGATHRIQRADLGYGSVEPEVAETVAAAMRVFAECGPIIEAADPGFVDPRWALDTIWRVAYATMLTKLTEGKCALLDPGFAVVVESGRAISAVDYHHAFNERARLGEAMQLFHRRYDLMVTPALPRTAFTAGTLTPTARNTRSGGIAAPSLGRST